MIKFPVKKVFDGKFVKVFDFELGGGHHYLNATRRDENDLIATKTAEELRILVPDAVSCAVILEEAGREPVLLLSYEYRYPVGRYVLSVPAGLIDKADRERGKDEAIRLTAIRELKEETGITFKEGDELSLISPMLFSSPGITDENNAMVRMVIHNADLSELTQDGCEGTELFDGFTLVTVEDAKKILASGTDEHGVYYSVYTWIALADFVGR